jgi:hypothetical protein
MPKYLITQECQTTQIWEFIIDAETEEEAVSKVENGDVQPDNYYTDDGSLNGISCEPQITEVREI